ncbi:hypodermin-B-like [Trichoplusia ni]|uniref:Hypodermin-B-like n=1 Tax=Trichoplusia ni TaxID=7111 RepID=A0A7E5VEQ2_TRINI|nr:hypodermin-B-like [Trichoplusia ni]
MENFVVEGTIAKIRDFPHVGFLRILCYDKSTNLHTLRAWNCGSSILNKKILLTAAHCLVGCERESVGAITVGHSKVDNTVYSSIDGYIIHEEYSPTLADYDIALVRSRTEIVFGPNVKRVAIMKAPPYFEKAQIAGWGLIDAERHIL